MDPFISKDHPLYPDALKTLFDPPSRLYYRGDLNVLKAPCLALVGTRRSTVYGNHLAFEFAKDLALRGATIVSGLAFGIDAQAHKGALAGGGPTVAVLAQSLEELQPSSHRGLAEEIVKKGGLLLSEYAPKQPTYKSDYLVRNRLIAGLCPLTVVVEAGLRSGALNTAHHALEMGRDVFCVPGRIGDPQSAGCLAALADGKAGLLTGIEELIRLLNLKPDSPSPLSTPLEGFASKLYLELKKNPASMGALSERFLGELPELYATLTELELRGFIHPTPQGIYCAVGARGGSV